MKTKLFAVIALLSLSSFGLAQTDSVAALQDTTVAHQPTLPDQIKRISLGLHGGVAINTGNSAITPTIGGDVLLDVQYAMYWREKNTHLGFLVGASLGYLQTGGTKSLSTSQYTEATTDGDVQYTIQATNLRETRHQLLVEVPVMFSLVDKSGVFFNLGPRFSFPVANQSVVSFSNPDVTAYFIEEGVRVPNETITGKVEDWQRGKSAQWNAPTFRMLLGTEIGYEFLFNNLNSLGLGLYANCQVAEVKKTPSTAQSFIHLTAPSAEVQPASVAILSPIDFYGGKLGWLDFGIKIAYHFNLK